MIPVDPLRLLSGASEFRAESSSIGRLPLPDCKVPEVPAVVSLLSHSGPDLKTTGYYILCSTVMFIAMQTSEALLMTVLVGFDTIISNLTHSVMKAASALERAGVATRPSLTLDPESLALVTVGFGNILTSLGKLCPGKVLFGVAALVNAKFDSINCRSGRIFRRRSQSLYACESIYNFSCHFLWLQLRMDN